MPRYQSTTVVNQVYTFNGTTVHLNVSYTPGTVNMGPMHQNWGYQRVIKQQTPAFNSFLQGNNAQTTNKTPTENTNTIIEQMTKLLNSLRTPTYQVQEVQAQPTSKPWNLGQASKLSQNPLEESE